jgi:hypothetical protein
MKARFNALEHYSQSEVKRLEKLNAELQQELEEHRCHSQLNN